MPLQAPQALARRYRAIGLKPEEYMPLIRLIDRWVTHSGEEWTVKRLKDLRQLYLHWYGGLPYAPETRIALRKTGVPEGPFAVFFRNRRGKRWFAIAWNALMVHTSFVSAKVTPTQAKKFLEGVRREMPSMESMVLPMDLVSLGVKEIQKFPKAPPPIGEDLLNFVPREAKERSVLSNRTPEVNAILAEASNLTQWLGSFSGFQDIVTGTLGSVMLPRHNRLLSDGEYAGKPVIGHVSAVQEPGYKARFIASPYPAVQQMLRPLHQWLARINQHLPGNWQFDQSAGLGWVRDKLSTNHYACSVDLSGATDHFPLKLQTLVLTELGVDQQWLKAVECFSTAMWVSGPLSDVFKQVSGKTLFWVSWTVGQPLGLIYSFNLFTITHWALCRGIQCTCGKGHGYDSEFGLVGDDVVWFCPDCARRYMAVMQQMGCPVSKGKTLESTGLAEFLSRVVTPEQVIPSYKWKAVSDDSFLDIARCLGPRSIGLFKDRQRRVIKEIREIPEPFGLGWNPKGLPYWERLSRVPEDTPVLKEFRLVSAGHHLSTLWYTTERMKGYLGDLEIAPRPTSDQEVVQVLIDAFGPIGTSPVLREHLIRDLYGLVSLAGDEFAKYGMLRPEVEKLLPVPLASFIGVKDKPVSAQLAWLAVLIRRFRHARFLYAETPERSTTLMRYEEALIRSSLQRK